MVKFDVFIIDRFIQPFANYLSKKGINCGYFGFNIFMAFISTFLIVDFLSYIINSNSQDNSNNIFSSGSLFFLPISFLNIIFFYYIFGREFLDVGKKIDSLSDNSLTVISIESLKKGTFSGIVWRGCSTITTLMCFTSTYSILHISQNMYIGFITVFLNYIHCALYVFIALFSGCYFTKPNLSSSQSIKKHKKYRLEVGLSG